MISQSIEENKSGYMQEHDVFNMELALLFYWLYYRCCFEIEFYKMPSQKYLSCRFHNTFFLVAIYRWKEREDM